MAFDRLHQTLGEELESGDYHSKTYGEYHVSTITGNPLKGFLDFMLEEETDYNNYMFQGTAVHYYLQESGILNRALTGAGFNPMFTSHEIQNRVSVGDGASIVGRVDTLAINDEASYAIDLKYTSLKPEYSHGRLLSYASQANAYAHMFGTDRWALLTIYSKADNIPDAVDGVTNPKDNDNWEIVKDKARQIHKALTRSGYQDGVRWTEEELRDRSVEFWEDVMEPFDESLIPAYEEELKYSDRKEWVLPYQDNWRDKFSGREDSSSGGGIQSFVNDRK